MTEPETPRSAHAIAKVATQAITRLGGPTASIVGTACGLPWVGPVVAFGVATTLLGADAFGAWRSKRVRRAIQRAGADDDWRQYYQEHLRSGGAERLRKQLLEMLRDLDAAVADSAVEPLTVLFVYQARGDADWPVVRAVASTLRRVDDTELGQLRQMLAEALRNCEGDLLTFAMIQGVDDSRPVLAVSGEHGPQFLVRSVGAVHGLLSVLVSGGAARPYAPSQAQMSDFSAEEAVIINRGLAEFMARLLAH